MNIAIKSRIEEFGYLNHYLQNKGNVYTEFYNKIKNKKHEMKKQKTEIQKTEKFCFEKFKV